MRPVAIRFNHMEITVAAGSLTERFADEIEGFYQEVFGFSVLPGRMFNRPTLLMKLEGGSFILLIEGDQALSAPGFDHLGLELSSRGEVDRTLDAVRAWQRRDGRVELKEYPDDAYEGELYHAYYVRHLLPIWFDVHFKEPVLL